ncbi:MAG: hypothetical protein LBT48_01485 [Prevotellaceae bacterium]|jgi:hypothetical protein|nr:hypothetical protein [Prevotellaceae bacterium]
MELKAYTPEECNKYLCAKEILGDLTVQCLTLCRTVKNEDDEAAIREFEFPYATWRNTLEIADKEGTERVYKEVKPLVKNGITLEYILQHSRYASNL